MIQRLADITTDATAAFEKESKKLLVRWDDELIVLALADKASGDWSAAEVMKFSKEESESENFVTELKQKSTLANYTGLQTQIYFATDQTMLIPQELADGANLFLQTQFGRKEGFQTITSEVNEKIIAGFLIEQEKQTIIQKLFPQAEIKSSLGLLVHQALHKANADDAVLLLCLIDRKAELAIIENGKLLLARCFLFMADEDVLYHLLNACRVFGIASQNVSLIVQGQVQKNDAIYLLLESYFANLQLAKATAAMGHPAFSQVSAHYFTPLIQP